jgi:coproporphyrinogen III oxidase-like Fe-S oxidoreductase
MINKLLDSITKYEGTKFMKLAGEGMDDISPVSDLKSLEVPAIYVHVPFCHKLCPFCCFNRYLFKEDLARAYFLALKKELDMYAARGFNFSDVYIGGGTPTILMDELESLIAHLRKLYDIKRVSVETTPPAMTQENIDRLKSSGVNRVSVGIQSFDDKVLEAMGRTITRGEEAKQSLIRSQGQFDTVNCDFIFNFPYQPIETFMSDVRTFKELKIDQATFYPLMPSPRKKTAMEKKFAKVDFSREPKFYKILLDELKNDGYTVSTVWCFSRGDHIIDEYIVDSPDYAGAGAGSVGLVNGNFYVNAFAVENYIKKINEDKFPIIRYRNLSEREHIYYYFLTKLFGMQVNKEQFKKDFGKNIDLRLFKELAAMKLYGLLTEDKENVWVTDKGMFSVSIMMRNFFASLNTLREHCINNKL